MLAEIGTWWLDRMGALLAPLLTQGGAERAVLLRPADAQGLAIDVLRRGRGRLEVLGRVRLGRDGGRLDGVVGRAASLTLLHDAVPLVREIRLPLAAEAGLATLLRYEMDRMTPFGPDDVFWTWRVIRRDRRQDTLDIELVLLPRAPTFELLAALAAAGMAPAHIQVRLPDGSSCDLPVASPDPEVGRRRDRRWRAGLAVAATLAVACVVTPVLRQSLALAQIEDGIAALHADVAEAQALQRRIAAASADRDALGQARGKAVSVLTALAALTRALPDDTYVTKLSVQQRRITLEGKSAAATRLIPALSNEPSLGDPAFTAPVLRGEQGQEIFALRVELAP